MFGGPLVSFVVRISRHSVNHFPMMMKDLQCYLSLEMAMAAVAVVRRKHREDPV